MNIAKKSDLLDVGFTGVDGFPSIQSCVDALAKKHEMRAAPSASRRAPHVAQTNYSQYRYLLHLPPCNRETLHSMPPTLTRVHVVVCVRVCTAPERYVESDASDA